MPRSTRRPETLATVREPIARPAPLSAAPGEITAGPRRRTVTTAQLAASMSWKV